MQKSTTYIKFSLVFLSLHFVSFYFLPLSLALFYGPIMYGIIYRIPIKAFAFHLVLPFSCCCYLLFNYYFDGANNEFLRLLTTTNYLLTIISMTGYFMAFYFRKKYLKLENVMLNDELLYLLWIIYCICCVFIIVSFLESINVIDVLNFNPLYLINMLIGGVFLIGFYYVVENKKEAKRVYETFPNALENSKIMEEYEKVVHIYLTESKLFLKQGISLKLLSEKINIPKHQLSILFNSYMHKSFYVLISEYRIKHAKKLIKENSNLTIESIAFECGFNSKSTFNKYFKEYTGCLPSEYRCLI